MLRRIKLWFKFKFWWLFPKWKYTRIIKLMRQGAIYWHPTEIEENKIIEQFLNFGRQGMVNHSDSADALSLAITSCLEDESSPQAAVE